LSQLKKEPGERQQYKYIKIQILYQKLAIILNYNKILLFYFNLG